MADSEQKYKLKSNLEIIGLNYSDIVNDSDWEYCGSKYYGDKEDCIKYSREKTEKFFKKFFKKKKINKDFPEYIDKCICGHKTILENCYIYSSVFDKILIFGNECIKQFFPDKKNLCEICKIPHKSRKKNLCKPHLKEYDDNILFECLQCEKFLYEKQFHGNFCSKDCFEIHQIKINIKKLLKELLTIFCGDCNKYLKPYNQNRYYCENCLIKRRYSDILNELLLCSCKICKNHMFERKNFQTKCNDCVNSENNEYLHKINIIWEFYENNDCPESDCTFLNEFLPSVTCQLEDKKKLSPKQIETIEKHYKKVLYRK